MFKAQHNLLEQNYENVTVILEFSQIELYPQTYTLGKGPLWCTTPDVLLYKEKSVNGVLPKTVKNGKNSCLIIKLVIPTEVWAWVIIQKNFI